MPDNKKKFEIHRFGPNHYGVKIEDIIKHRRENKEHYLKLDKKLKEIAQKDLSHELL